MKRKGKPIAQLHPTEAAKVKKLVEAIAREKQKVAASRDKLRSYLSDLEDIVESVDAGVRDIECGIDSISQHL